MLRLAGLGAGLALAFSAQAQGTYKCTNAAGKITYSGQACADIGLKSAGEVRESLNTVPLQPEERRAMQREEKRKPPPPAAAQAAPVKAEEKKAEDERRCFKTAKGMRCNDKPEEK